MLSVDLPVRWSHVRGVAAAAGDLAQLLSHNRDILVSAAWLHDVGYASEVAQTGFHPLDGARFLREDGWDESVVGLVAHHSFAVVEARLRGLEDALVTEFPNNDPELADALCVPT